METRSRRSPSTLAPGVILGVILGVVLAGCGTMAPTTRSGPAMQPSVAPSVPAASIAAGIQTDTAWGRIWDAVPSGFPMFPGISVADPVSPDPVSATFAVEGGDPAEIASWMETALKNASFGTESLTGPQESGGFVLESVGEGDCRIRTTVAPMGSLIVVTVLYGAACPAA